MRGARSAWLIPGCLLALTLVPGVAAAGLPGAPCPEPLDHRVVLGSAGTHLFVDSGCASGAVKVCAPTWIGGIDLLMVC